MKIPSSPEAIAPDHNESSTGGQEQCKPMEIPSSSFSSSPEAIAPKHNEASAGTLGIPTLESRPIVPDAKGLPDEAILLRLNQLEGHIVRLKRKVEEHEGEIAWLKKRCMVPEAQNPFAYSEITWF